MKGKVTKVTGPTGYEITGEDGKTYFCHIGDLKVNEDLVKQCEGVTSLSESDEVEFDIFNNVRDGRAIRVKKVK